MACTMPSTSRIAGSTPEIGAQPGSTVNSSPVSAAISHQNAPSRLPLSDRNLMQSLVGALFTVPGEDVPPRRTSLPWPFRLGVHAGPLRPGRRRRPYALGQRVGVFLEVVGENGEVSRGILVMQRGWVARSHVSNFKNGTADCSVIVWRDV